MRMAEMVTSVMCILPQKKNDFKSLRIVVSISDKLGETVEEVEKPYIFLSPRAPFTAY